MRKCDLCKKICKKTKFGSCIIFTKTNTITCISCSEKYRFILNLKGLNILKYILKRQIYMKN